MTTKVAALKARVSDLTFSLDECVYCLREMHEVFIDDDNDEHDEETCSYCAAINRAMGLLNQ